MKKPVFLALSASLIATGCTVTPKPLPLETHARFGTERLALATANQEPISNKVDLYEAMARALKYNLDTKVEVMEAALKLREADLVSYSALPKIVAGAGYAGRSQADASEPSTRDDSIVTADLTASWNILDFGLSYVRAKQATDEVLVQDEMKRRMVNKVIEDVRTAYWRAVSYQRLVGRMRALEGRVARALKDTRNLSSNGETSPLVALTYERELIEIKREVELLEGELLVAQTQLSSLMNVKPGTPFTLEVPQRRDTQLKITYTSDEMFNIAATNRPEMREISYRLRINEREVDAALLDVLPGINFYAGPNYDSNEFITTNDWVSWGAKVSFNLMKLATLPAVVKKIDAEKQALDTRSLSVAMAVMTQVHISRARYAHLKQSYSTAAALSSVSNRILKQVRTETAAQKTSEQMLIREEMNSLLADAKLDMAYADLQNAYANIYASLGIDPFPQSLRTTEPVKQMADALRNMWLERGEKKTDLVAAK
jgi:outer membrane protein TolC